MGDQHCWQLPFYCGCVEVNRLKPALARVQQKTNLHHSAAALVGPSDRLSAIPHRVKIEKTRDGFGMETMSHPLLWLMSPMDHKIRIPMQTVPRHMGEKLHDAAMVSNNCPQVQRNQVGRNGRNRSPQL
eukprot:2158477-Amphidinium_carterae.1